MEASSRNLARGGAPSFRLDRDEHGRLIVWRENRAAAHVWLAIARPWQLGGLRDHPITGLDLGLALNLADRMALEYPDLSVSPLVLVSDLSLIEMEAVNYFIANRNKGAN